MNGLMLQCGNVSTCCTAPLCPVPRGEGLGVRGNEPDQASELGSNCFSLDLVVPNNTSSEAPHPRPLSPQYRGEGRSLSTICVALVIVQKPLNHRGKPGGVGTLVSLLTSTILLANLIIAATGCHRDMRDQPRYETLESSNFFNNGQSARPAVAGTIARGELNEDDALYRGKKGGQFVTQIPIQIDRPFLERGRERFNIYCTPCHDRTGSGAGMIVQRGFQRPPTYHDERLRKAPAGHFYDVITRGFGAMPRYAPQLTPRDRWAVVAYIRALQLSQNASLSDVPDAVRASLGKEQP